MRKALLALLAVSIMASLAPAHATDTLYTRTIVASTAFGGQSGVFALPSVLPPPFGQGDPTNPNSWRKLNVVTRHARCAYVTSSANAQNSTTGKLGYVLTLPSTFTTGDSFSLAADASNPKFDFDVYFVTSLGVCAPDADQYVSAAGCNYVPVPIQGDGPKPPANEYQTVTSSSCAADPPGTIRPRSIFTTLGNEPMTALTYNANYAIVVMPVGANGKFDLTLRDI